MGNITEQLLEQIKKFPERYKVLKQNPLERCIEIRDDVIEFKPVILNESLVGSPDNVKLVLLDTETTGTKTTDEIIELAFVVATYNDNAEKFVSIDAVFDRFIEPVNNKITDEITRLTGITTAMVAGKTLTYNDFKDYLPHGKYFILAHNASFDRRFIDKTFPEMRNKPWADTMSEINWSSKGYNKQSLEMLMYYNDMFYNAHRAVYDCLALLAVIVQTKTMHELYISANNASLEIEVKVHYDAKETVKGYGFRWCKEHSSWKRLYQRLEDWNNDKQQLSKAQGFNLLSCKVVRAENRYCQETK